MSARRSPAAAPRHSRSQATSAWRRCRTLPTSAEAGIPAYICSGWIALLAPAGTPKPIIARLNQELAAATADPAVIERLTTLGAQADASTPEGLTQFMASEAVKWRETTARGGIEAQ